MKVFDYTGGEKGALLGDIARPSYHGGCLRDDAFYSNKDERFQFHFSAGRTFNGVDTPINVAEFGVDAICFCIGEWTTGSGGAEWVWCTLYTDAGFEKALKDGTVVVKSRQKKSLITFQLAFDANLEQVEAAAKMMFGDKSKVEFDTGAGTATVLTQFYVKHGEI